MGAPSGNAAGLGPAEERMLAESRAQLVLGLIVRGRSNDELGDELFITLNTVKTLIRSIYRKIGVTTRAQAVAWGVEHGFPTAESSPD
jgi:DNA-binding CsgD family transcriptional regulator